MGLTVNQLLENLETKQFLVLFNNKEDVIIECSFKVSKFGAMVLRTCVNKTRMQVYMA